MKSLKTFHASKAMLAAGVLLLAGCASRPPARPQKKVELVPLPEYQLTQSDWKTGTRCMVYPMFGNETHQGVNTLNAHLKNALEAQGYEIVELTTYMSMKNRDQVQKIIRPMTYTVRSAKPAPGEIVYDLTALYVVEDAGPDSDISPRLFQVWGRKKGDVPYSVVADNFLQVDGFREALETDEMAMVNVVEAPEAVEPAGAPALEPSEEDPYPNSALDDE